MPGGRDRHPGEVLDIREERSVEFVTHQARPLRGIRPAEGADGGVAAVGRGQSAVAASPRAKAVSVLRETVGPLIVVWGGAHARVA